MERKENSIDFLKTPLLLSIADSFSYLIWCVCLSTLSTDYKKYLQSSEFTKVLLG